MKGSTQTIRLEGYGSYAGMYAEAMLVGVNDKHITLASSNPLDSKEKTQTQFRIADGCKVRSVPERGFAIPKNVVQSIVKGESVTNSSSPISNLKERKGKKLPLKTKAVGKVPLKSKTPLKTNGKAPEPTPEKRGPGRPRKNPVETPAPSLKQKTSVKAPVAQAEAPRRRGRPPKEAAIPLPKGQARIQLSKGIADYVVSEIKPKTADENMRSLREAIRGGVHTNYVEVVLSKELAQTLIDFLASHYEKFGTMGVTGGAYRRGIPSLMGRLQEGFKGLKVPRILGGSASSVSSTSPVKTPVKTSAPVAEVKRGPGRPKKVVEEEEEEETPPVKRGPGRPKGSVNKPKAPAPVNKVPLKPVGKKPLKRK